MQHPADGLTGGSDVTMTLIQDKLCTLLDQSHVDSSGALTAEGQGQIIPESLPQNTLPFVETKTILVQLMAISSTS